MHENLQVTDGVYGILSGDDIKNKIYKMGNTQDMEDFNNESLIATLEIALKKLKS